MSGVRKMGPLILALLVNLFFKSPSVYQLNLVCQFIVYFPRPVKIC